MGLLIAMLLSPIPVLGMAALWRDNEEEEARRRIDALPDHYRHRARMYAPQRLSANTAFLADVRERSGYGTLRALHDALVYVAIAAIVGGSLYLCSIAPTVLAGAIVVGVAALFVVALLIERWVFVLIVDTVDVYVDRTRREAEGK